MNPVLPQDSAFRIMSNIAIVLSTYRVFLEVASSLICEQPVFIRIFREGSSRMIFGILGIKRDGEEELSEEWNIRLGKNNFDWEFQPKMELGA